MRPSGTLRLYERLPAHIRTRDEEHGRPLQALLHILQDEFELLEADIERLYESWFIETADEWVVPYIADLLGVRNLRPIESAGFSMRAYVANTLRYRQGKGTPAVLEQLAKDVSGWEARVVEFFQLLATTQHLNHVRLSNQATTDIRSASRMQLVDTAFDTCAHTAEVRRIDPRLGRHNIPNVGLYLWRLQPYFMQRTAARKLEEVIGERFYHFGPLNHDFPLFNRPKDQIDIRHIATERNVPTTIRRLALSAHKDDYLDHREPVIECWIDGEKLEPTQIIVCHLSWEDLLWTEPTAPDHTPEARVAVDPDRGRLFVMNAADELALIETSYTYGFPGDVGGGPYDRNADTQRNIADRTWRKTVARTGADFISITDAVNAWNALDVPVKGVIAVLDNLTYAGGSTVRLGEGDDLLIVSCRVLDKMANEVDASESRAHIIGDLSVEAMVPAGATDAAKRGMFTINGFLIEGKIEVLDGDLGQLNVAHCTVMPSFPEAPALPSTPTDPSPLRHLTATGTNTGLKVNVHRSIVGGIALAIDVPGLCITDSIIDGSLAMLGPHNMGSAIQAPSAQCTIERSTIWGADNAVPSMRWLFASESIFMHRVVVERKQEGCVRFCHMASDPIAPRRFRCQPDLALQGETDPAEQAAIRIRMRPQFNSITYGEPDYAQLDLSCDKGIREGAEDGSEMGVFQFLKQPQREANLRAALEEYLPFGLQAGLLFIDEADAFRGTTA